MGGLILCLLRRQPFDDLRELTDGINGRLENVSIEEYLFDDINLPQVINLMAGQTILMNHDRLTKNYYVHKDPETGLWSRFPWDVEQAFSNPQWEHFVSVLYGDSEHTQGTGNEPQFPNFLLDAILDTPRTRQMFLERVRTLMDQYLGESPGYFEQRIDELAALIGPDAELDHQRWQAGPIDAGIQSIKENLQIRRDVLATDRLVPDSESVIRIVELLPLSADVTALVPTGPESGVIDGVHWHAGDAAFPDTPDNGWIRGTTGVGYDTRFGYEPYINLDVGALMDSDGDGTNDLSSVYTRMEFEVADPGGFDFLELQLRYDDGFVAYLNGHAVASDKMPDPPAWDSVATRFGEARESFVAFEIETMAPDGNMPVLVAGTNVLAVHLINRRPTDSDLLLQPRLVGGIAEPRTFDVRFGSPDIDGIELPNEIAFNPTSGNQDEEYVTIVNDGNAAVDMSGWSIDGGLRATFQPGTVLPANSTLYLTPNLNAFRNRSTGPAGMQTLFVQELDGGHLSNFGETLTLRNAQGHEIATVATPAVPSPVQSYLRISELHFNPIGTDDATEFIELMNISDGPEATTLDLSGVAITAGPSIPFLFPEGSRLSAGQRIVVVRDQSAFTARYPTVDISSIAGQYTGRLDNGGELLKVEDGSGSTVVEFRYGDGARWPAAADGVGASLEVIDPTHSDRATFGYPSRWRSSLHAGGTPSARPEAISSVLINEVRSRSVHGEVDAVELHNVSTQPIDIGGWSLSDSSDALDKFQIPIGTMIAAGGYVVFDERDFNPTREQPQPNHFAFSNEGDDVWLTFASDEAPRTFADHVSFGASDRHSFGRTSSAHNQLIPQARSTLGAKNRGPMLNDLMISEVNYHPPMPSAAALAIDPELTTERLEFIELRNAGMRNVRLAGWRLAGAVEYSFSPTLELPGAARVLVVSFNPDSLDNVRRLEAFRTHYGLDESVRVVGGYVGNLSNSEEHLRLLRPNNPTPDENAPAWVLADQLSYEDRGLWPLLADGNGASLQRNLPSTNGLLPANWRAAVPTPGLANDAASLPGDLTGDGQVTGLDIDRMFDTIYNEKNLSLFDLNRDTTVDQRDVDVLVQTLLQTTSGDGNLDGQFSSTDLVLAFQAGEYEDELIGNSTWATGDWNGDGEFSSADFVHAFQRGVYVG